MSAYVEMKDVTKVYQMGEVSIRACDGVNFEIEKGQFVIIVGPSGGRKDHRPEYSRGNGYRKAAGRCMWTAGRSAL